MPLKKFSNGDVFGGADMDALTAASTMRFATPADRTAGLVGALAPANGTVTALQNDHLTYKYNGSLWLPPPGTLLFNLVLTGTSSGLTNATWQNLNAFTSGLTRNWGGWWNNSIGRCIPQWPGLYELQGGACFYHTTETNGLRMAGFALNGNNVASSIAAETTQGVTYTYVYAEPKPTVVMCNGTTDYFQMMVYQNSGTNTVVLNMSAADRATFFSAKYLG
jgi:hypothetical protein